MKSMPFFAQYVLRLGQFAIVDPCENPSDAKYVYRPSKPPFLSLNRSSI